MESSPSPPSPSEASPAALSPANGAAASTSNGGGGRGGAGEPGKLFVGGIPWDATEDVLRDYFAKYGEVTEAIIMRERGTGNARGFGFVSFSDPSSADKAIQDTATKHAILGRPVEVKRAIPRGEQHHQFPDSPLHSNPSTRSSGDSATTKTKKIFVGGLSATLTQEEFKGYFEKFGKITDVVVMYDSVTHRPRGFGFITFETEDSATDAIETTFQTLNGKIVEVKKAIPRDGGGSGDGGAARDYNRSTSHNLRAGNSRGLILDGYTPAGMYPPYSPRLPGFHGYGGGGGGPPPCPPYGYRSAGEGYGYGAAYGVGYGMPYASPRRAWNGAPYVVGGRQSPPPYAANGGSFFPGYFPGGGGGQYVGVGAGGYQVNGKWAMVNGGGANGIAHLEENGKH